MLNKELTDVTKHGYLPAVSFVNKEVGGIPSAMLQRMSQVVKLSLRTIFTRRIVPALPATKLPLWLVFSYPPS
jgi:hypothetical protein